MINTSGIVMGMLNDQVIVHKRNSKISNRNYFVVGGPGSFKTQSFVLTNVVNINDESIVVTDPKGEIYEKTAKIKQAQGYDVQVLNFKNMDASDHYNPIEYVRKEVDATVVANALVAAKNDPQKKDFWYNAQLSLLKALILYVKNHKSPSEQNILGILNFLQRSNKNFSVEDGEEENLLDNEFSKLDDMDPARRAYELGFAQTASNTRSNVMISLLTTIGDFINSTVSNFTSNNSFNLNVIGEKKTIIYVLLPTIDTTWEGLINLFFTQMFQELYLLGDGNQAKLKYPVVFLLDEFPNLGKFNNYEEFLATCRGYDISCCTICQNMSQLVDKYGKNKAESILGNCAVKICLGNVNEGTANYFSNLCGKATIKINTGGSSISNGRNVTSHSNNYSYSPRNLINVDEILTMDPYESLLIISGQKPIKVNKAIQFQIYNNFLEKYKVSQTEYTGQNKTKGGVEKWI